MFFVGCLLLGIGLGLLIGHTIAGILIGLGVGCVVEGVLNRLKANNWRDRMRL